MIGLLKIILKILPWLLVVLLLTLMLLEEKLSLDVITGGKDTYQSTILTRVEEMGNLELVKYNFQEVTEVKKAVDKIDFKFFKLPTSLAPDSRAVLISQGSAAGCIDLSAVRKEDIREDNDTLYVTLPTPNLCYFKIDLEKSRLYDLEISAIPRNDQKKFMEELYKVAEAEIKASALKMGILEQTRTNARLVLQPLFENLSNKPVIIKFRMDQSNILNQ